MTAGTSSLDQRLTPPALGCKEQAVVNMASPGRGRATTGASQAPFGEAAGVAAGETMSTAWICMATAGEILAAYRAGTVTNLG